MKFGLLVEVEEGLDWDSWRRTFRTAEDLGFESIWLSDHLQSPWTPGRRGLETWTALAVAAVETRRLVLGSLVTPVTFREPAILARMANTLASLSQGRFVVGLGLGWNAAEHAAAAIPFPSVGERARRLERTIAHIRCEMGDRRVRILVGGKGARATLPIVARYADEWNLTTASPTEFAAASEQLEALCREAGRDHGEIERSVAMGILVGRDATDLRERGERMRRRVPPLASADDVVAAASGMGWLVGTPDALRARLAQLAERGVQRAILGHYDLDGDMPRVVAETCW